MAWWSFDSSNAVDNSGNGHTGTVYGATAVSGVRGAAFDFDGANDWVKVPSSPAFVLTNDLTIGAWIRMDRVPDSTWGAQILWYGDTAAEYDPYCLRLRGDRIAQFRVDVDVDPISGTGMRLAESPTALPTNTWQFLVGTVTTLGNQKTLSLYIDGSMVSQTITNGIISYNPSSMWVDIGAVDNGTWQFFDGIIDEPFIYNRALSQAEIQQIQVTGIPEPTTTALVVVGIAALGLVAKKKASR